MVNLKEMHRYAFFKQKSATLRKNPLDYTNLQFFLDILITPFYVHRMNGKDIDISLEDSYLLLKEIEKSEISSQRDFAGKLGYSLGKVNYLLKALAEKGLIKMENFSKSNNKLGYRYVLTPKGVKEKYSITADFLKRKEAEFIKMQVEIENLRRELVQK